VFDFKEHYVILTVIRPCRDTLEKDNTTSWLPIKADGLRMIKQSSSLQKDKDWFENVSRLIELG